MKAIEQRAIEYAKGRWDELTATEAYISGAKEQKEIADDLLLKLKSSWEEEAQINHNDESNYKQGYHDAIEEACEWFSDYLFEIGNHDDWERDRDNTMSGEKRFRKAMEE